jgi:hypothetical protein
MGSDDHWMFLRVSPQKEFVRHWVSVTTNEVPMLRLEVLYHLRPQVRKEVVRCQMPDGSKRKNGAFIRGKAPSARYRVLGNARAETMWR